MNKTGSKGADLASEIRRYCQTHEVKLTPLREKVLSILSHTGQPMVAYAILEALQAEKPKLQVMSVYRVLDYLLSRGLIHRIEKLNAFIICCHLSKKHLSQWLICEVCGHTDECALPSFQQGIDEIAEQTGFAVTSLTIELLGICSSCRQQTEAVSV